MRYKLMFGSVFAVLTLLCWAWPAVAQQATGAAATKDCPVETVALGQVVTCTFTFENIGVFPAVVTTMTETRPSGTETVTCIADPDGDAVATTVGDILPQNIPCVVNFDFTIPNDTSLCGTFIEDSAEFEIYYESLDLTAGAFATHVVEVECEVPPTTTTTTTTALPTTTTTTTPFVPVTSPPPSTPTPTPTQNTLPMTGNSIGLAFFAVVLLAAGTFMIRKNSQT
jgi:cell division septation protein DedD